MRGGNLSTPNQAISWASIGDNKPPWEEPKCAHKKKVLKSLPLAGTTTCSKKISTSIALIWLIFSLQSYFMVCYYHHQEEKLSVIQGIKMIIGLIRGICILMRHSVMGPLQAEMLSCCALTRLKRKPPGLIVLSLETHYPVSMMQYISTRKAPMTSQGNWLGVVSYYSVVSELWHFTSLI